MGRPSVYAAKVADEICAQLADGMSLNAICKQEGFPPESTVRTWELNDLHGFAAKYARAREIGYEKMAEEILEISDDGSRDYTKVDGRAVPDYDHITRSKLRVDTRKWLLSKMLPKKYGDKIVQELTGKDGAPLSPPVIQFVQDASPSKPSAV